jgi:hypothetical protein
VFSHCFDVSIDCFHVFIAGTISHPRVFSLHVWHAPARRKLKANRFFPHVTPRAMAGAGEVTLADAKMAVDPLILSVLPTPSVWDSQAGSVVPTDFPTAPLDVTCHSKIKVFVDVIMDVESYDKAVLKSACSENRFHDLPEPSTFAAWWSLYQQALGKALPEA